MSASLKHILISYEEYERLKQIESEYHKLHNKIGLKLTNSGNYVKLSLLYYCFATFLFQNKNDSKFFKGLCYLDTNLVFET